MKISFKKKIAFGTPAFWWLFGSIALAQTAASLAGYEAFTISKESGGNLSANNPSSTAVGEYQLTEAALVAAGYGTQTSPTTSADYDGSDANFQFNGTNGINNLAEFEASPAAQSAAFVASQQASYSQLTADGATSFIGQTVNGQVINQSALLSGAQLLGAGGMHQYLENGGEVLNKDLSVNEALTQDAQARIAAGSQYDVSAITGGATTTVANSDPGANDVGSAAVNGMYCDPNVSKVLAEGSQAVVQGQMALAQAPGTGFTLLNGESASQALGGTGSSAIGAGSFSQFSCLSNLLNGDLNVLFEPPSLSQLLAQFENAVCSAAQNEITQMTQPLNQALFDYQNVGGFFPGESIGDIGGGIQTNFSTGGTSSSVSATVAGSGTFTLGGNGSTSSTFNDYTNSTNQQSYFNQGLIGQ
jgi:hypothetical protein